MVEGNLKGPGVLGQDVRHTNVVYAHMMYHAHNVYISNIKSARQLGETAFSQPRHIISLVKFLVKEVWDVNFLGVFYQPLRSRSNRSGNFVEKGKSPIGEKMRKCPLQQPS